MPSLLKLIVIGTILVGVAHGASLATADAKKTDCTLTDGFQALSCTVRLADVLNKVDNLDLRDKNDIREFRNACDALDSCSSKLTCGEFQDAHTKQVVSSFGKYCDALVYVNTEFPECREKLDINSECFKNWNPLQNSIDEEKDEKKREELKKNACKNYFGKDQCLKKLITETCSEKEWQRFHDNLIPFGNALFSCGFENAEMLTNFSTVTKLQFSNTYIFPLLLYLTTQL